MEQETTGAFVWLVAWKKTCTPSASTLWTDVRGALIGATSCLENPCSGAGGDVGSLIRFFLTSWFLGRWGAKETKFTRRENTPCKSFWRLKFVRKEPEESDGT